MQNDLDWTGPSTLQHAETTPSGPHRAEESQGSAGEDETEGRPGGPMDNSGGKPSDTVPCSLHSVRKDDEGEGLRKRRTTMAYSPNEGDLRYEQACHKKARTHRFFKDIHPKEPFTFANQIQRTLLAAWVNVLLVFVPAGITLNCVLGSSLPTFFINFVAVIPLYFVTDLAIEELDIRLGRVLSNLLSVSTR